MKIYESWFENVDVYVLYYEESNLGKYDNI